MDRAVTKGWQRAKGLVTAALVLTMLLPVAPAGAEVRFGKNVRVGGHDFSHQTFTPKRRAVITIYEGKPKRPGCVWRKDGRGGRVKVCHLQRKR